MMKETCWGNTMRSSNDHLRPLNLFIAALLVIVTRVKGVRDDLVTKDLVHLFESLALGLREEEDDNQPVHEVGADEQKIELPAKVLQSNGRDLRDQHVGSPVRACANGSSDGSDTHGEDFTLVNPGHGTEADTEEQRTEEEDESHSSGLSSSVITGLARVHGVDGGFDRQTENHTERAEDERLLAANSVDDEGDEREGDNRSEGAVDTSQHEGLLTTVAQSSIQRGLEIGGDVDTSELAADLDGNSGEDTFPHGGGLPQIGEVGGHVLFLILDLVQHFGEFLSDEFLVIRVRMEQLDNFESFLVATLLNKPSGGVGQNEHPAEEQEGGDDLDAKRHTPLTITVDEDASIADPVGNQESQADHELSHASKEASQVRGRDLGLIQGDDHGETSNRKAGNNTADDEHGDVAGTGLESASEHGETGADLDSTLTTNVVRKPSRSHGTKEATTSEGGNDGASKVCIGVVEKFVEMSITGRDDTPNNSRVISEQE